MNARTEVDAMFGATLEGDAVARLRVPPHSIESETSVLGGLLLDNNAWDRVGDTLTDADFYRYEHRLIYAAISALVNACKPADVITVFTQLESIGKAVEVGGLPYLNSLAQYVPSAANIRRHAETVRERSVLRKLISASDEIATSAFNTDGKGVDQVLDQAESKIFAIRQSEEQSTDDWEGMDTGVLRVLNRIQDHANGNAVPDFTPTGLTDLDNRLDGGMRGGELIVIGARPSMGKSALGLTIAVNVAGAQGLPVGMFSMEMPKHQVHSRAMALAGQIHLSRIKRPERLRDEDWPSLTEAVERLRRMQLDVNDQSGLNINQVRAKSRALRRRRGKLGAIVVDYLGLMRGTDPRVSRTYQIEEITQGLKALAKELDCPVLLLVQLSREVEKRTDHMPILSDLRDSGSIEQDADIVIFVHRPFKANPDLGEEWKQYAKLSVAKVRDGDPGYLDAMYVGEHLHFQNWPTTQEVPRSHVRTKPGSSL